METDIKQQVRDFYDQVGWKEASDGFYQNAHYEDLRPVSRKYIHRCHLRVQEHLRPAGHYLLDAGSGPIQYPEYLEYSRDYQYRICADISIVALREARKRMGKRGLFVVADIASLPFKPGVFEGIVSLHTIHHLPAEEHLLAYQELYRTLAPACTAVVVNGWDTSPLGSLSKALVRGVEKLYALKQRFSRAPQPGKKGKVKGSAGSGLVQQMPKGTYVCKHDPTWLMREVGTLMPLEIWVWRSVSVQFLRTFIHARRGGEKLLRGLFWLEERFPHFFGENGVYPLVVLSKR